MINYQVKIRKRPTDSEHTYLWGGSGVVRNAGRDGLMLFVKVDDEAESIELGTYVTDADPDSRHRKICDLFAGESFHISLDDIAGVYAKAGDYDSFVTCYVLAKHLAA